MRWLSLLVVLATLAGCKKDSPPPPPAAPAPAPVVVKASDAERDRAFWTWVAAHLDELKAVKTGHEPVTEALSKELEKVEPGLVFELGVGTKTFELIISADGDQKHFPMVKRLVAAATPLPGTTVIAFRPRKEVDGFSMQLGEQKLGGSNLWFTAKPDAEHPGLIAVTLYVEGMTDATAEQMKNAAFMLLEAAVGEFDLETKIGVIDIVAAPARPTAGQKKLKELPATLDGWK